MVERLLRTKLYIPPLRSNFVPRPRLIRRLADGQNPGCKLTLVSAPAGYGKSTLISIWIHQYIIRAAWFSLDTADNDPTRFLSYLIAAIQQVEEDIGSGIVRALRSTQRPPINTLLTSLINEIDGLDEPLTLVLDDYHLISAQPIHDALTFLLNHLPGNTHLVISTRQDPPIQLARLRGRGELVELRQVDLSFTLTETTAFLKQFQDLNFSTQEVSALEQRTEGWITGLQLAALSMHGRDDLTEFISAFSGSHRYILDYLMEEVLNRQSKAVRSFLLKTSVLDQLCGSLCNALTQRDDGQQRLEQLDGAALFILPLDNERTWYRYHHLFVEVLRARLTQSDPSASSDLLTKAAEWYEVHESAPEAISCALRADDYNRAARLVETITWETLIRGELTTLLSWMEALPQDVVTSHPQLRVNWAAALTFSGQLDKAKALLDTVLVEFANTELEGTPRTTTAGDRAAFLKGSHSLFCALIADMLGEVETAEALAREADRLLPPHPAFRTLVIYILAQGARNRGDLEIAVELYTEIAQIGHKLGNVWTVSVALCELATIDKVMGRLHQAADRYEKVWAFAKERGGRSFGTVAQSDVGMADLLLEWNQLNAAEVHIRTALRSLDKWSSPTDHILANLTLAQVLSAQGNMAVANQALQEARAFKESHQVFPQVVRLFEVAEVKLWLAQDRLDIALAWAEEQLAITGAEISFARELIILTAAQVLVSAGKSETAGYLLSRLAEVTNLGGRKGRLVQVLTLLAVAMDMQDKHEQALAALIRALELGEPGGYIRTFVNVGFSVAQLLQIARKRGTIAASSDYVKRIVTAFETAWVSPVETLSDSGTTHIPETLSEREIEILELVAVGLSNREIAERLFLAVGTVKSHLHNIYGKLDTRSRTGAITHARELNLLK